MPAGKEDQELVDRLNHGDSSAFEALYFRHRDWVVRLASRFTRNEQDALDVMQETFAYLAWKFPGFKLSAAMTSFLYPVVRNLSIAARNRSKRFAGETLESEPAESRSESAPDDLHDAMRNLSEDHREVLLMRFVDDLSLQEIADALGVPLGTVKSRLHHAIESLRNDERAKKFFLP